MGKIQKLPAILISQIAAGEVIESPAAVVKELVENSLDAKATKIDIFCHGAGLKSIQVRDDGEGILREDLPLALESFATSKLSNFSQIFGIQSFGFRGEALAAIRSVAQVTIESRYAQTKEAYSIKADPEKIYPVELAALPFGTKVVVENLFFNTPVRKKFLKDEKFLRRQIIDIVTNVSLAHPSVQFSLHIEDKSYLFLPKAENLLERISAIYETPRIAQKLLPVFYQEGSLILEGYISAYDFFRASPSDIRFFVSQRPIQYRKLLPMLKQIYGELLPHGRFPFAVLFLSLEPYDVDVNVHPQKKEVRFKNETQVLEFLEKALRGVIEKPGFYKVQELTSKENLSFHVPQEKTFSFLPQITFESESAINFESEDFVTKKEIFFPQKIHTRLFDTFILATSEDGIFLIDQHTAEERVYYEEFLARLETEKNLKQDLALPVSLILSPVERQILEQNQNKLFSLGFALESFGPAGYELFSVPFYLKPGEEEVAFRLALSLVEKEREINTHLLFEHLAKNLACRSAIKKGEDLSIAYAEELVQKLLGCKVPLRCPHGRPTVVFLDKKEVFSLFRRSL